MWRIILVVAMTAALGASSVRAQQSGPIARPHAPITESNPSFARCKAEAKQRGLHFAARRTFMKQCFRKS